LHALRGHGARNRGHEEARAGRTPEGTAMACTPRIPISRAAASHGRHDYAFDEVKRPIPIACDGDGQARITSASRPRPHPGTTSPRAR